MRDVELRGPIEGFVHLLGCEPEDQRVLTLLERTPMCRTSEVYADLHLTGFLQGFDLVFRDGVAVAVFLYPVGRVRGATGDGFGPVPVPLFEGLAPDASAADVRARLGEPAASEPGRLRYPVTGGDLWLGFDDEDRCTSVILTAAGVEIPAADELADRPGDGPALYAYHTVHGPAEWVTLVGGGQFLEFYRDAAGGPVSLRVGEDTVAGAVVSVGLADDGDLLLHVTDEAAQTLGLAPHSRLRISSNPNAAHAALTALLGAAGSSATGVRGPLATFIAALGHAEGDEVVQAALAMAGPYGRTELSVGTFRPCFARGLNLLVRDGALVAAFLYPVGKPRTRAELPYDPFPSPPIEGLAPDAGEAEIRSQFGEPEASGHPWLRYRLPEGYLWFGFGADGTCDAVTVATEDVFAGVPDEPSASAPDGPRLTATHLVADEREQVILYGDGFEFVFSRRLDADEPVVLSSVGADAPGAVLSLALDDSALLLQISDEAAEALDLGTKTRIPLAGDAEHAFDLLLAMLVATGEFEPPEVTPAAAQDRTVLPGPIEQFIRVLGEPMAGELVARITAGMGAGFAETEHGGNRYLSCPDRGIELLDLDGELAGVLLYTSAQPGAPGLGDVAPYPTPPILGLAADASGGKIRAHLGEPDAVTRGALRYDRSDWHLWIQLDEDDRCGLLIISTYDLVG